MAEWNRLIGNTSYGRNVMKTHTMLEPLSMDWNFASELGASLCLAVLKGKSDNLYSHLFVLCFLWRNTIYKTCVFLL